MTTRDRMRRQQIRVLAVLLLLLTFYLHEQGSAWTPIPLILGAFLLKYSYRRVKPTDTP